MSIPLQGDVQVEQNQWFGLRHLQILFAQFGDNVALDTP